MAKFEEPVPASGVYAAILTPRSDGSTEADVGVFLEYIDKICQSRVNGIVLFGSTGEFVHYDLQDRMRVASLAVKRSRVPVLVNVSHSSLQGAVELAEQAEVTEAAGMLLMPPYFYRYQEGEIEQFYQSFLAQAAPRIPLYIYNFPQYTNALSPQLVAKLLQSGRFAGIKDSSGDWDAFQTLLRLKAAHSFQAISGSEALFLDCMRAGGDGIISGIAAAVPELMVAAWAALAAGNVEEQERLGKRISEFVRWAAKFPALVAIKYAADARGWLPAQLATPLGPECCRQLADFKAWLPGWLPA